MMRRGEIPLEEGALDGREGNRALDGALFSLLLGRAHHRSQRGDRLVLEELLGVDLQALLAGTGDHLDGDDGIAAQLEEVVVDADAREAEEFTPDGGETQLDVIAGSLEGTREGGTLAVG